MRTSRSRFVFGLDLGQTAEFSALCGVQLTWIPDPRESGVCSEEFAMRYLRRWPLGTSYPQVVRDVAVALAAAVGAGEPHLWPYLVVDQTGVGAAVVDLFKQAALPATLRRVLVTAGHQIVYGDDGTILVPKRELASVLQRLLQTRQLKFAPVPERDVLVKELQNFKVKITAVSNENFQADWREGPHDDLVLALGFACWFARTLPGPTDVPQWGESGQRLSGWARLKQQVQERRAQRRGR